MTTRFKMIQGVLVPENDSLELRERLDKALSSQYDMLVLKLRMKWVGNELRIDNMMYVVTGNDVEVFCDLLNSILALDEAKHLNFSGHFILAIDGKETVPSIARINIRNGKISSQIMNYSWPEKTYSPKDKFENSAKGDWTRIIGGLHPGLEIIPNSEDTTALDHILYSVEAIRVVFWGKPWAEQGLIVHSWLRVQEWNVHEFISELGEALKSIEAKTLRLSGDFIMTSKGKETPDIFWLSIKDGVLSYRKANTEWSDEQPFD